MSRKGASGGYHGDLSIPGYKPKTPTVAPPKKWAAKGPAGTYAGAQAEYESAVTALPAAAEAVTRAATRQAAQKRAKRARKASQRKKALALTKKPAQKVKPKAPKPYKAPDISDLGKPLGDAIGAVADAVKTVKKVKDDAVVAAVKLPEKKVTKAFGKPTLGTPKVKELVKAKKEGRLSGVRRGKVVATPQARKAKKRLKRAQKVYAKKAKPNIEGLLNEEQERFAEALSKETGLPPKLAGDWTLKESGASSAGAGGEAGEQNQLGVGYPAHPTAMSQSPYFNNTTPEKAAKATAEWMEGKIGSEYDYQAAPSIQEIPKLAKAGASDAELRAYIAGPSAWGTGEIPNSPQVTASPGKAGPKATKRLKVAKKKAAKLGIKPDSPKVGAKGSSEPMKLKGPFDGSRQMIRKIFGAPVHGDKEEGHSPTGDHDPSQPESYAQDIGSVYTSGNPAEGEPSYSQKTVDKMVRNIRKMGGDIPDMALGADNWEGTVGGYRIQFLTIEHGSGPHIHVGARWTGESTGTGYAESGSGGSGISFGSDAVTSYAAATGQSVNSVSRQLEKGKLTGEDILQRLESFGLAPGQKAEQSSTSQSSAVLDELAKKYKVAA